MKYAIPEGAPLTPMDGVRIVEFIAEGFETDRPIPENLKHLLLAVGDEQPAEPPVCRHLEVEYCRPTNRYLCLVCKTDITTLVETGTLRL